MEEKKVNFEEYFVKIEGIISAMESNELTLQELINNYDEGISKVLECKKILDQAEQKIETIRVNYEENN